MYTFLRRRFPISFLFWAEEEHFRLWPWTVCGLWTWFTNYTYRCDIARSPSIGTFIGRRRRRRVKKNHRANNRSMDVSFDRYRANTQRGTHTHTHARARARSRPSAVRGPLEYCQYSVFIILLPVIKLVKISSFSLLPVLCLLSILLTMRLAVNL